MNPINVSLFIQAILPAVLKAGAYAVAAQGKVKNIGKTGTEKLATDSDYIRRQREAKTVVDEEVQERLLLAAHTALKGAPVRLDVEEVTVSKTLFPSRDAALTLVIDPIDGTLEYTEGKDDYSICLALIFKGEIRTAIVYFPRKGDLYLVGADGVSYLCKCESGKIVHKARLVRPVGADNNVICFNSRFPKHSVDILAKNFTPLSVSTAALTWHIAFVRCIAGEYRAMMLVTPQIRDVLLGAVIEHMPGGYATDFSGNKLKWPDGGRIPEAVFGFGDPITTAFAGE
jgi:fructose-1,6-bisphosphatase/inositol monophosphatase family enzyme